MHVSARLVAVPSLFGPPVVLEVVPAAFEREGVHGACVAVAREDPAAGYAEEVHEVALGDAEEEGEEGYSGGLGDPEARVLGDRGGGGGEDVGNEEVVGDVWEGRATVGDGFCRGARGWVGGLGCCRHDGRFRRRRRPRRCGKGVCEGLFKCLGAE